jgi:hypothetical protein
MRTKNLRRSSLFCIVALSVILLATMIFVPIVQAQPSEEPATSDAYKYPILPGTDGWKAFTTHDEMITACQVPENELSNMSVKGLVETVIDYPLLSDYRAFDDLQTGFEMVAAHSNCIQKLYNTKDGATELLASYSTMDPAAFTNLKTETEKYFYVWKIQGIQMLLAQEPLLENLTVDQRRELCSEASQKSSIMEANTDMYGSMNDRILTNLIEKASGRQYSEREYWVFVMTPYPYNYQVDCKYKEVSDELTLAQKADRTQFQLSYYPNVTVIRNPSARYNCHSYAWHDQSAGCFHWIESDVSIYWTGEPVANPDPYIVASGATQTGWKVRYSGDIHSAIVYQLSPLKFISKWGDMGLYVHAPSYCPYGSSYTYYEFND